MLAHKTNLELHLLLMRVGLYCQLNLWGLVASKLLKVQILKEFELAAVPESDKGAPLDFAKPSSCHLSYLIQ